MPRRCSAAAAVGVSDAVHTGGGGHHRIDCRGCSRRCHSNHRVVRCQLHDDRSDIIAAVRLLRPETIGRREERARYLQ
jgi:hypothetical protein